jgi:hypothetical protein
LHCKVHFKRGTGFHAFLLLSPTCAPLPSSFHSSAPRPSNADSPCINFPFPCPQLPPFRCSIRFISSAKQPDSLCAALALFSPPLLPSFLFQDNQLSLRLCRCFKKTPIRKTGKEKFTLLPRTSCVFVLGQSTVML